MKKFLLPLLGVLFFVGAVTAQAEESLPKVSGLKVTDRTTHTIEVRWTAIDAATQYHLRVTKPNTHRLVTKKDSTSRKTKIHGLKRGSKYAIKVRAENESDHGKYSEPEEATTKAIAITLSECAETSTYSETTDSANVCWEVDGTSELGYKLVWSKTDKPTYPTEDGDTYAYYSDPETVEGEVTAFDGAGTYYVRVCEYLGGECGVYSNQITVELTGEETEDGTVNSITLSECTETTTTEDPSNTQNVCWEVDGYSDLGFKLVWSLNENPTYPTGDDDTYAYYSDPDTVKGTVTDFDGSGTYYVRVCEYLGGECGVYSNEITVDL
ncbi:MAG: fibronectin type III domain-containing protein [Patescibacteria group bacterium]|jgi:hypothetical protein